MPTGFEILNNSGNLLLSADTVTPGLRDTRTITASMPTANGAHYVRTSTTFSNRSRRASLVVQPLLEGYDLGCYISSRPTAVGTLTMQFVVYGALHNLGGGSVPICKVHVIDDPLDDGPNQGLRLYDSSGKLTFSSNYPPLRVVTHAPGNGLNPDVTYSAPSGRIYGYMPSGRNFNVEWATIGQSNNYLRIRGTVIRKAAGNGGIRVLYNNGIGTYVPYQKSAQAEQLDLNDGEHYSSVPTILGGIIGDITYF